MAKKDSSEAKHLLRIYGPAAALVLIAFIVAFQFIKPAPPDKVVMATGGPAGAYYAFGQRYAAYLAKENIVLELRNTAGSVENIALLEAGEVDLAMVQGGIQGKTGQDLLLSLGSVYYEPLWLFHRTDQSIERLTDLKELKVAIGREGSGTRALVEPLLMDNGMGDAFNISSLGGGDAAEALLSGEVDAAFFVTSASSGLVKKLLEAPGISVANLRRSEAYARRYRYLNNLKLPEGVVDLANNIPHQDLNLLAPTANVVVHPDTHPAVIDLMLQAASEVHSQGGWFEQADEFPKAEYLAFPLSKEASRYYKYGPPFLQRYLPLWAASLLDRIKVMLLPLLVLMIPLFKVMPPIYTWRMRARVYRWYSELEAIDEAMRHDGADKDDLRGRLKDIEEEVRDIELPLSFTAQVYDLRQHIDLVYQKLA